VIPIDAIVSVLFEGFSAISVFIAFYFAVVIYRKYPHLTRAGWLEIMFALFLFGTHLLLDMFDTLVYVYEEKRLVSFLGHTEKIRPAYTMLDICENFLAVVSLIFLIVGFARLSNYIYRLWRGVE